MRDRDYRYLLVCIVLAGLALRFIEYNEPWIGLKDFTGALHGQIAKNYLRFGYLGTAFGPVTNFESNPEQFSFYLHHPPLFNLILSIPILLFGDTEGAMRLLPIVASTTAIVIVFLFARKWWGDRAATLSAMFMAFLPMEGYFGRMVNEETIAAPIIVGLCLLYKRMMDRGRRSDTWVFYVLLVVGLCTAWPVYYTAGFLFLHRLLIGEKTAGNAVRAAVPPLLAFLFFGLFLLYQRFLTGSWEHNLLTIFLERAGAVDKLMTRGNLSRVVSGWMLYYFTPVAVVLSGVFMFLVVIKRAKSPPGGLSILLLLYLVAASHVLIFREGALRHEFWLYYFSAPIAVSSALGLEQILSRLKQVWLKRLFLICVSVVFISVSVLRVQTVHAIDKFANIPDLGSWLRQNTGEDDRVLVIGPDLARFGYSEDHFDYYPGEVYTWPMPHLGYYAERRLQWGVSDLDGLRKILEDPGAYTHAVMTQEYEDDLVRSSRQLLRQRTREIPPEEWGKDESVPIRIFVLKEAVTRNPIDGE